MAKTANNSNIVAIVQARMQSSRLPAKMLLDLHGRPLIDWVHNRIKQSRKIHQIIFAIPNQSSDDPLESHLLSQEATVHRGPEADVLTRFISAAELANADIVVRICADNPLISAEELDRLVDFFNPKEMDYAYNHIPINNSYPDGLGAEICSFKVLRDIGLKATLATQREHVFKFIWDNPASYRIRTFDPPRQSLKYPTIRLDVDTLDDLHYLRSLDIHPNISGDDAILAALSTPRH